MLEKFKHKNELKDIKKTGTPAADHLFEHNLQQTEAQH